MNSAWVTASRPRTPTQMEDLGVDEGQQRNRTSGTWDNDHVRLTAQNLNNSFERRSSNGTHHGSTDRFLEVPSSQPIVSASGEVDSEERLRRKLFFFFMDPVRKFIARRQTPWKLLIQFLKIILVTFQLIVFGSFRYEHTNYYADNDIGFKHLFLKNWDSSREINAYPPSTGTYALYTKSTFYELFDNTADIFFHLEDHAINPIFKNSSFDFCVESFVTENGSRIVPIYDPDTGKFKTHIDCLTIPTDHLDNIESQKYLKKRDFDVPWEVLERMHVNFTVRTTTYRQMGPMLGPACFTFDVKITFDNSDHDGQISINLESYPRRLPCVEEYQAVATISAVGIRLLDFVVILNCLISFALCSRALFRAQILCVQTRDYFKKKKNSDLSPGERFQFLNLWYMMICVNDILIIVGSILKELIELRETSGDLWNFCSVFLGTGSVLVWTGMLRYLGFFESYNVLILTLKGALPNVVRFVICAGMVYLGYLVCGWVVFGPYHFKFTTLDSTSECLFSLINGDDMFATFSMISKNSPMIHGFSRIYLYSFIMLFTYVILSLFIAIIMDTFEVIKEYYKKGFPKSRVDEFYTSVEYDHYSDVFLNGSSPCYLYRVWAYVMTSIYGESWRGWRREYQPRTVDNIPILT